MTSLGHHQSGLPSRHSTETATISVMDDLLCILDASGTAVLVLLDLSAAFDTINHETLINALSSRIGVVWSSLEVDYCSSFLHGRSQYVWMGTATSDPKPLNYGVPQRSVISPLLFSLYMEPLGDLVAQYGVSMHRYADDTQLYLRVTSVHYIYG